MLKHLIEKILYRNHYWRTVGFGELSELYSAQLLRTLGISLIGLFTPVYLYTIGYSLVDIARFHVFWFLFRPFIDLLVGKLIGSIGPKHTMLMSSVMHVIYLGLLMTLKDISWPFLLVALTGSTAYSMHLLSVMVNFSKIKHQNHGGKELGTLEIMSRIGGILGPLIGGLIANYFDPRYTIALAMLVLLGSTIPLFMSSEAVMVHQHIRYRGLRIRKHLRDYMTFVPLMIENSISIIVWPLYAAVFLLGDNVFVKIGAMAALSTMVALVVTRAIGKLIDDRKGRSLLRFSLSANAILHLFRVFVSGPLGVLGINLLNEPVTTGYRMPYMKGLFDASDSLPGYRIAYLATLSALEAFGRLVLWALMYVGLLYFADKAVFQSLFVVAAFCSLGVMWERFPALKQR